MKRRAITRNPENLTEIIIDPSTRERVRSRVRVPFRSIGPHPKESKPTRVAHAVRVDDSTAIIRSSTGQYEWMNIRKLTLEWIAALQLVAEQMKPAPEADSHRPLTKPRRKPKPLRVTMAERNLVEAIDRAKRTLRTRARRDRIESVLAEAPWLADLLKPKRGTT